MPKTLLLFAHPALEKSRVNRSLIEAAADLPDLTFHDLYEAYPDFYINVQREQGLLLQHDLIIWQHPLYWYSVPPLLKQWIDLTLQHDWAYGSRGIFLRGKRVMSVVSTGAARDTYAPGAFNRHELRSFLLPLERTAELCGMTYLPPYLIDGTHQMNGPEINTARAKYRNFLEAIQTERLPLERMTEHAYANEIEF